MNTPALFSESKLGTRYLAEDLAQPRQSLRGKHSTKPALGSTVPLTGAWMLLLLLILQSCPGHFSARAAEPWADDRPGITNDLELWFDVSRQHTARRIMKLAPMVSGRSVDYLFDGSGKGHNLTQPSAESRPRFFQDSTGSYLRYDGSNDSLTATLLRSSFSNAEIFLVAAPRSNAGNFRGFFGFGQTGQNDYTSGLNFDMGPSPSQSLSLLNVEGAGAGGAVSLWSGPPKALGGWHIFAINARSGQQSIRLSVDAVPGGTRDRRLSILHMDTFVLGGRYYSNTGDPPFTQGHFHGDIAELLLFKRGLEDDERSKVLEYLAVKHAALLALPPATDNEGSLLLVTVTNPPPLQMLVPGFKTRELPVALNNINNLKYRPDGKLVALGYDGKIHLLSDTDGDGLEDKVEPFWDKESVRAPIGLALTPLGYARGQGVFVPGKGKVVLIVDTNADDRADLEIPVATWTEPSEQHGVDALGVALDKEGNLYFGLGAASFTGAYLLDQSTGQSRYSLNSERGTILKVSPDFTKREIVCTGIRFPVALAFNRNGDLFCTDQEGATWLPNGNPLDELLHIETGRHYGFPPRHPRHLPNVIDEPSVFDYAPQHQSTCGLNFNDAQDGGRTFGPPGWEGDAFVTGYSRGKIYRTKLVATSAGYVAQNQLIASLTALTVDACVSPQGNLVVATHSGQPDWGSGPNGKGRLYQIRFEGTNEPQPLLAWSASATEIRVAFDRPLNPARLKNLTRQTSVTQGRHVFAGDRFETLRPGYQVVYDQLAAARFDVPVLSAGLTADERTIVLSTRPRVSAVNYALTLPGFAGPESGFAEKAADKSLPQHPSIDLLTDLSGVQASWSAADGKTNWGGWLPHLDLSVSRKLTEGSADHDALWHLIRQPGVLRLRGQLDLSHMLQPAVQPGSELDFDYPAESVNIEIRSGAPMQMALPVSITNSREIQLNMIPRKGDWATFDLSLQTGSDPLTMELSWTTANDQRPRALPLRRFLMPWATAKEEKAGDAAPERSIPEIAGGNWLRGKQLFFGESLACSKCHRIRSQGHDVGPDLSNLVHRDYTSVLKDLLEPNAAINPDHIAYNVDLVDGESLTAILKLDGRDQLTFADAIDRPLVIPRERISSIKPSTLSLMPEALLTALAPDQLKDLMTFLLTSPLEPAAIEAANPPPPRTKAELAATPLPAYQQKGHHHGQSDQNATGTAHVEKQFHIVLCAGPKDHGPGEHDYPLWQARWKTLLSLANAIEVSTAMNWPDENQFRNADVIVFYSNNPGWNNERAGQLDDFLARGGGLVYLHYAVDGHKEVDALANRIGLAWRGGASKFRHGAIDLKLHAHPLAAGLGKLDFIDESYWQLVGDPGKIDLLASGSEDGVDQPLFWTRTQGKGRVFVSILGHYNWTFDDPLFRLLVLRGICWSGAQPMDRLIDLTTVGARLSH